MITTKQMKYYFFNATLACSSVFLAIPHTGTCTPSDEKPIFQNYPSDFDFIISNLFYEAQIGNIQGINLQLQNIASIITDSDDALTDSCRFLQGLVARMNELNGTSRTLSEVLQLTKDTIHQMGIAEDQSQKYIVGLDLINLHQLTLNETDLLGYARLAGHHKKSNFWTWLTVATVAVAAVTVCIVVPQVAPAVIGGAVEVGKAAFSK